MWRALTGSSEAQGLAAAQVHHGYKHGTDSTHPHMDEPLPGTPARQGRKHSLVAGPQGDHSHAGGAAGQSGEEMYLLDSSFV